MQVVAVEEDLTLPLPSGPRTPGVHLSGIIRCIAVEEGLLKQEVGEEDASMVEGDDPTHQQAWWEALDSYSKLRIAIGLAWEQWYITNQLPTVVDHPGELEVDGVYMTPDGEEVAYITTESKTGYALVVHEVKATYKSIRTVGDLTTRGSWMWIAQVKSYCRSKKTRFAVLHVLFLCGDYSWPQRPRLVKFYIEFEQAELDSNWILMTDYRDYRIQIESMDWAS